MNSSSLPDELSVNYISGVTSEAAGDFLNASSYLNSNLTKFEEEYRTSERYQGELFGKIKIFYVPFIVLMGVTGNNLIGSVLYFTPSKFRPSSYFLSSLAIADTCFLLNLFIYYLQEFAPYTGGMTIFCRYQNYINKVSSSLSIWYTVGYTVERYIAVQYPTLLDSLRTPRRTILVICCVTAAVATVYLHIFLINDEHCDPIVSYMEFAWNFFIAETILTFFLPFLTILTMNILIVRQLLKFNPFTVEMNGDVSEGTLTTSFRGRYSQHSSNVSTSGDGCKSPVDKQKYVQDHFQLNDVKDKNVLGSNAGRLSAYVNQYRFQTVAKMLINIRKVNCANKVKDSLRVNTEAKKYCEKQLSIEPNEKDFKMENTEAESAASSEMAMKDWQPCEMDVIKTKVKIYDRERMMNVRRVAVLKNKATKILTMKKNIYENYDFGQCESVEIATDVEGDISDSTKCARSPSTPASLESTSDSSLPLSISPTTTLLNDSSSDSFKSKSNKIEFLNEKHSGVQKISSSSTLDDYLIKKSSFNNSPNSSKKFNGNCRQSNELSQLPEKSQKLINQEETSTNGVRSSSMKKMFCSKFKFKGRSTMLRPEVEVATSSNVDDDSESRIKKTYSKVSRGNEESVVEQYFQNSLDPKSWNKLPETPCLLLKPSNGEPSTTAQTNNANICYRTNLPELPEQANGDQETETNFEPGEAKASISIMSFLLQHFRNLLYKKQLNQSASINQTRPSESNRSASIGFRHYSSLRQIKKYHNTTVMLIITSSVFLALHFPNRALRTYANFSHEAQSEYMFFLIDICDQLDFLHYSINFFLYCFSGSSFRGDTKKLLMKAKCRIFCR